VCYFHNPSSQQAPNRTPQNKTEHWFIPILSLFLSLVSNVVEWIKWVAGKGQPRLPPKGRKTKKEENKTTTNFPQGFVAFEFSMGCRGGEFVRPLLPMGKNPLLHLSEGFEFVAEFSRFLSMGRKTTTSSIFFGASKSSSSAILTLLSLLLSGFIVVYRRLKCEI